MCENSPLAAPRWQAGKRSRGRNDALKWAAFMVQLQWERASTIAAPLVSMDHMLNGAVVPVAVPQLPAQQRLCVCRRCVYFLYALLGL